MPKRILVAALLIGVVLIALLIGSGEVSADNAIVVAMQIGTLFLTVVFLVALSWMLRFGQILFAVGIAILMAGVLWVFRYENIPIAASSERPPLLYRADRLTGNLYVCKAFDYTPNCVKVRLPNR